VKVRDYQRSKVYAAEWAAHGTGQPDFATHDETVRYANQIMRSEFWQDRGLNNVAVGTRNGRGGVAYGKTRIGISAPARKRWVVIHELAHCATLQNYANTGDSWAGHGWQFCELYVDMVDEFLGGEIASRLQDEMDARKVQRSDPGAKPIKALDPKRVEAARKAVATRKANDPVAVESDGKVNFTGASYCRVLFRDLSTGERVVVPDVSNWGYATSEARKVGKLIGTSIAKLNPGVTIEVEIVAHSYHRPSSWFDREVTRYRVKDEFLPVPELVGCQQ